MNSVLNNYAMWINETHFLCKIKDFFNIKLSRSIGTLEKTWGVVWELLSKPLVIGILCFPPKRSPELLWFRIFSDLNYLSSWRHCIGNVIGQLPFISTAPLQYTHICTTNNVVRRESHSLRECISRVWLLPSPF